MFDYRSHQMYYMFGFLFLVFTNKAAMNMAEQESVWDGGAPFGYMPGGS